MWLFRPVGKTLPISLIHIYWCETLGGEEAPRPHPLPRPGQVSTKNRLHVTQILLFVSRLAPESSPYPPPLCSSPPLGLPSNCGRVAEIFSLLQAKARQYHGPRRGTGWGPGRGRLVLLGNLHTSVCLGMGSGETGPRSPREGGGWNTVVVVMAGGGWRMHRHRSSLHKTKRSGAKRPRPQTRTCHLPVSCAFWAKGSLPFSGLKFFSLNKMGIMACIISFNAHDNPTRRLFFPFHWLGS